MACIYQDTGWNSFELWPYFIQPKWRLIKKSLFCQIIPGTWSTCVQNMGVLGSFPLELWQIKSQKGRNMKKLRKNIEIKDTNKNPTKHLLWRGEKRKTKIRLTMPELEPMLEPTIGFARTPYVLHAISPSRIPSFNFNQLLWGDPDIVSKNGGYA